MASKIDPTKPVDGIPAEKADLRANFLAAKTEIETLQAIGPGAGGSYLRPEPGGIQRSLAQLAIDQGINVKEFGALGDGSGATIGDRWIGPGKRFFDFLALRAVYPHAEAVTDTVDWVVLQHCCDLTKLVGGSTKVYLPAGRYVLTRTLQVTRGWSGTAARFDTVQVAGEPSYASSLRGTVIDATRFLNAPALAISGARHCILENFAVLGGNTKPLTTKDMPTDVEVDWLTFGVTNGRYNAYCGIAIDPYAGPKPAVAYPTASDTAYGRNALSSIVWARGLFIRGFAVGWLQSPSEQDWQGDWTLLEQTHIDGCHTAYASGGSQNRANSIIGGNLQWCRRAFDTVSHGVGNGNLPYCFGVSGVRFFEVLRCTPTMAAGVIKGGRFESIHRIGSWAAPGAQHGWHYPLVFEQVDLTFGVPEHAFKTPVHLETTGPVSFNGCAIYPYIYEAENQHPGIFNVVGSHAARLSFDACLFITKSAWRDQGYIVPEGPNSSIPVKLRNCVALSIKYDDLYRHEAHVNPVHEINNDSLLISALPRRLALTDYPHMLSLHGGEDYRIVRGNPRPSSAASGYSHTVPRKLTFIAANPADFVPLNNAGGIPGDILYWREKGGRIVPMLRVIAKAGSAITCEKLFSDGEYDQSYSPAAIMHSPRQWAPGVPLRATTSGSSAAVMMSHAGVVEPGDWITDGTNVRRVADVGGPGVTLTSPVNWSSGVEVWWAKLRPIGGGTVVVPPPQAASAFSDGTDFSDPDAKKWSDSTP